MLFQFLGTEPFFQKLTVPQLVMVFLSFYRTLKIISGSGSSVTIATGYGLDGPGIESRWGEIFRTCPDRPWGPPSLLYVQWVPDLSQG